MLLAVAGAAHAHGFGQRFDLPLPLWLWEIGAGATIVLTFAIVAIFMRERSARSTFPRMVLWRTPLARRGQRALLGAAQAVVALVFVVALLAGFFGNPSPYSNLLPTLVWVEWWVGFAFISALVGDAWRLVNPLRSIASVVARAVRALLAPRLGRRAYPPRLAAWPGVVLFLGFAWCELVWQDKDTPAELAAVVLGYAVLTWAGMLAFGQEAWLANGEAFSIAFSVLGRFAPLGAATDGARDAHGSLALRPYGAALLVERPVHASLMCFVLCMLATVTFDGFQETSLMQRIDTAIQQQHALAVLLFQLSEWGVDETQAIHTVLLVAFPLPFLAVFLATSAAMAWLVRRFGGGPAIGRGLSTGAVAREFVLTLVPIAVAYHLSHYFSLLLTAGQFIIPLASDPFGLGWNLFGTAKYAVDLAIVSPYFFWYAAVVLIVVGHVIAVLLAHKVALRVFAGRRGALVSQIPMVALMVAYTTLSLWILAQPIVS